MREVGPEAALRMANIAAVDADGWLTAGDRLRFSAITSVQRRQQFLAGRWLVRELAAEYREDSPAHFSISHSGDRVVAAIATFPVGIDLEQPSRPRDFLALAELAFSPAECAELRTLPESERSAAFYRFWTLKEATGKREGHGLQLELARRQRPVNCAADEADLVSWQFADCSLALAGKIGMSVRAAGLPAGARPVYWRIEPALV